MPGNSVMGRTDGEEAENDVLTLGEEHWLPSGLIWVAMSLLKISPDILVAASLKPPNFSSVRTKGKRKIRCIEAHQLTGHIRKSFSIVMMSDELLDSAYKKKIWTCSRVVAREERHIQSWITRFHTKFF